VFPPVRQRVYTVNIYSAHGKGCEFELCIERAWNISVLRPNCFDSKTEVSDISVKELLINEDIRDKEVRVIGADGAQLGVMSSRDAQRLAEEAHLDLVKIAPQATPPVCRIMDYGKYRFEQSKREKEARKNQRVIEIKEVRLSLNIDVGDLNTKVKQATKFLKDGNKLKVSIRFRGREMAHPELGQDVMNRFAEMIAEYGNVEKQPKLEGRHMLMFVAAKQPAK